MLDTQEVWHCDLYRLTHPDEAFELGLDEAFETAICLIEWPDRLGTFTPPNALKMAFKAENTHHTIMIDAPNTWGKRLESIYD